MHDVVTGLVDRRRRVAGPAGALRASKFAPGEFVASLAKTAGLVDPRFFCLARKASLIRRSSSFSYRNVLLSRSM